MNEFEQWLDENKNYSMFLRMAGKGSTVLWKTEWKARIKNPYDEDIMYHVWIKGHLVKSTSDYSLALSVWRSHGCA